MTRLVIERFRRRERERLARDLLGHARDLVQQLAGLDLRDPVLDVALALTLPHFERLLGNRLVWEHADPDVAAAFDEARHRAARGFDHLLARRVGAAV